MNSNRKLYGYGVGGIALGILLIGFFAIKKDQTADFASTAKPAVTRTYAISGYLPEKLSVNKKSYVVISGRLIKSVSDERPTGMDVFETESIIFPGMVDMHSHIKYNILPLWPLAKGQFLNRFEWRKKFAPYKDAVSYNMKAFPGNTVCAAVRWAEIKALTGGVTSLQGLGNDGRCAAGFGIHNIEIPGEYGNTEKIRAATDILDPSLLGAVYQSKIDPEVQRLSTRPLGAGEEKPTVDQVYDQALTKILTDSGIINWLETFYNQPRSMKTGLRLLLGTDLNYSGPETIEGFEAFKAQFVIALKELKMNDKAIAAQLEAMKLWLFGNPPKAKGYMQLSMPTAPMSGLSLIGDSTTMDFFGKAGVISVDKKIRRYLAMYETATRRSLIKYLTSPGAMAVIAHLSEGMRTDNYNKAEYKFISKLGLNRPGMVLIHAVGMGDEEFQDAAQKKISIVWSPFSNLLLYGETLDVERARRFGINLAIGADWTPTGSKNLLDELKIARRYLDKNAVKSISDKDLVEMATVNAAKALRLEKVIGQVAPGFQADLMLVAKPREGSIVKDPYSTLVSSTQADVNLVLVSGDAIYGEPDLLADISKKWGDLSEPELLPRSSANCNFKKAFRNLNVTPLDVAIDKEGVSNFKTVAGLDAELQTKLVVYRDNVRTKEPKKLPNVIGNVDRLFTCEDQIYQNSFNVFIEKTLDENRVARKSIRAKYKLDDKWSPLSESADTMDSGAEEM